ncbi:MAG: 2,3-bisphosphoglycerate-independent phosphoglycerate mutase [Planctomycetia bacterium]|nr:2,3-bisphosphoglycerate-independent phosphoglycerate mutase [Planctomycetia bacterium]
MNLHDLIRELREPTGGKIVLLVADGLGGLPLLLGGKTELETARTPHLDTLACEGVCGLSLPVLPGITPGSGPGHLGLFGYDPLQYRIGRGVLEALGINFQVTPRDVAIRGNFCTVDADGLITDRRAGRPSTERCIAMCQKLAAIRVPGVEVFVEPVREHRFVLVLRGDGLGDRVNDTDPQATGVKPLPAAGEDDASQRTAEAANQFLAEAARVLKDDAPTNMATLRGFARYPQIATMQDIYGLKSTAIAVYPMYKGLARLVGMDIADAGSTLSDQVATLQKVWPQYDFFFMHYKYTDSTGEDGNFAAKVEKIEQLDAVIPQIRDLNPDVLIVTGDHSTPSKLKSHSWHPVPVVLWAKSCRSDGFSKFSESQCRTGGLGQFQAMYLMSLAMAHAGRFGKYGA